MSELSQFYRVKVLNDSVEVVRTRHAFADVVEIRSISQQILAELQLHRHLPLLVDLRDAPGRSDPAFEEHFADYRLRMLADHPRAAILVQSAVGSLQVRRHMREDHQGQRVRVFQSLPDARAYITGI